MVCVQRQRDAVPCFPISATADERDKSILVRTPGLHRMYLFPRPARNVFPGNGDKAKTAISSLICYLFPVKSPCSFLHNKRTSHLSFFPPSLNRYLISCVSRRLKTAKHLASPQTWTEINTVVFIQKEHRQLLCLFNETFLVLISRIRLSSVLVSFEYNSIKILFITKTSIIITLENIIYVEL